MPNSNFAWNQKERPSWVAVAGFVLAALLVLGLGRWLLYRARRQAAASEAAPVAAAPEADLTESEAAQPGAPTPLRARAPIAPFSKGAFHPWLEAARETVWWPSLTEGGERAPAPYGSGQLLPIRRGLDRTTVLLLGVDARGTVSEAQKAGEAWQTDTIMLLTLDPKTGEAGVLSIPRDLWIAIPGHDTGRINTVAYLGELYHHPGGGAALAMETVEANLGVAVDHYVRVDFRGFVELVDLIGGVDVVVEQTLDDPNYPGAEEGVYERLVIEAGPQHFDGDMALKYVRTRYSTGDFDRARRQQQVLRAVLKRVTALELLPELASNAPEIYATLRAYVQTDMPLDKMLRLATAASQVERDTIHFAAIDATCTQPWTTPFGGQVLLPRWDKIRQARDHAFHVAPEE